MRGSHMIPFNRANREAAGVAPGDNVSVRMAPDTEPRVIEVPPDLARALERAGATEAWSRLSYTHQREHVEAIDEAVKPETRARRIATACDMLASGKRRACCFDRSGIYSKGLAAPEAAGPEAALSPGMATLAATLAEYLDAEVSFDLSAKRPAMKIEAKSAEQVIAAARLIRNALQVNSLKSGIA